MRTTLDGIKKCSDCEYFLDVSDAPNMQGLLAICKLDLTVGCDLNGITSDCPIKNNASVLELIRGVKGEVKKVKEDDWYEKNIEKSIRPIVKLLRNNGFNTVDSCETDMHVVIVLQYARQIDDLWKLLRENNYKKFSIDFRQEFDERVICRNLILKIF